jgi:hypothetical protein
MTWIQTGETQRERATAFRISGKHAGSLDVGDGRRCASADSDKMKGPIAKASPAQYWPQHALPEPGQAARTPLEREGLMDTLSDPLSDSSSLSSSCQCELGREPIRGSQAGPPRGCMLPTIIPRAAWRAFHYCRRPPSHAGRAVHPGRVPSAQLVCRPAAVYAT